MATVLYPTKDEANMILQWASVQNPGPWINHCKHVAKVAETIAHTCGLDTERAYVSGLLHDIGYYAYRDGKGETCHIYSGYEIMAKKGYPLISRICLTHSFAYQDFNAYGGSDMTCSEDEKIFISEFIASTAYDDYDRLIQLCDCLASAQGICIMEKRMLNVVMRHGFNDFTLKRWESQLALKKYFDDICGNIYKLFYDELLIDIFERRLL
ncbi:MAG: HD domain-containing protein [Defluviitaleaceae bacterium]|nr:HD domain-containing protein [Defluviitaleaceae bacterium]